MDSLQQLQDILNSINANIIVFRHNQIVLANRAAIDWLQLPSEEITSTSIEDWLHPACREKAVEKFSKFKSKDLEELSMLCAIKHPTLGKVWIDATIKPFENYALQESWIVTFSSSKKHSVARDGKSDFVPHSSAFLNEPLSSNMTLRSILSDNYFVDNALENFLKTLRDIVPYDSASIAILENDTYKFIASFGLPEHVTHESLNLKISNLGQKDYERIFVTPYGSAQIINDTSDHPSWVEIEGINHIRSWMGIELRNGEELLGILNIDSSQPDFFDENYAHYALALAQQAVLALVYTDLYQQFYEDMQDRTLLQQTLVKNLITTEMLYAAQALLFNSSAPSQILSDLLHMMSSALEDTGLGLIVFNIATGELTHYLQNNLDPTIDIWDIFRQIAQEPDLAEKKIPSNPLTLPADGVITLSETIEVMASPVNEHGVLFAIREGEGQLFSETEFELIDIISNQITVALEKEALTNQLQQQTLKLSHLVDRQTEQIQVEQKRLKAILDSTADGIFYMEDFQIQYANPTFCHMVGYAEDELRNKPLSMIRMLSEDTGQHNFESLLDNPVEVEPGRNETRLRHKDGTEFYVSIRFSLVGLPGESPVRMVAIVRDISQERKLYFQRARFIANAAHELRTPLSSLVLRLHMLKRQPEKMKTHLESLDNVTDYLRELVEELLKLSRFERGMVSLDKDDFVLQQLIEQAIIDNQAFAEAQAVQVQTDLPEEDVIANVDGKYITEMLNNLIVNGINYTQEHGHVMVKMTVEEDMLGNHNAIIHVLDDGQGIELDLLPHEIFEPFARPSQGSRKETGMGLALVREIVTLHGGTIQADNQQTGGSVFQLNLPIDN